MGDVFIDFGAESRGGKLVIKDFCSEEFGVRGYIVMEFSFSVVL